ncbi:Protein NRT1/ PTR FAMILY 2.13 [Dichanthelium oligosanthes]|uniref:Protein NRT1/ PTR FAMILY 2.13 n=1 Tax=Dichanthelium oligosanthes TaxID=888268 RepID=A0A1E5VGX1_9POAL|nr:Protein NRT1/ PTR FAMILY 2.13 [Dichanthelium oligosanthes]
MCEGGRPAEASMASSQRPPQPGLSGSPAEEEAAAGGGGAQATRRRPRGWRAVAFIIGVYAAASIGTNAFGFSLTTLLIGRYNMKPNAATNVNNVFSGTFSFTLVIGAFVADALWGRFSTLLFGIAAGVIASCMIKPHVVYQSGHGMAVITLSATVHKLKPPPCSPLDQQAGTCVAPSALQRAVLYVGMGLLVVSAAGTNPTSLPFGADQFDDSDERHKGGLARFYSGYYAIAMMATFLALTVVVYVQVKVSWGLGFAIPTVLMAVAFAVFLAGTRLYVYVPPEGSIFSSVARVFVASCSKWRLRLPHPDDARRQEELLYNGPPAAANNNGRRVFRLPLTLQLRFLNKAAIMTDADEIRPDGSPARPWNLCSVQQVEEAKCLLKIIPVWISGILWFTVVTELTNYTFLQASTMDLHMGRHFTIPPVSIVAVFYLSVALFVPVYDLLIARAARRVTKGGRGITLLQRQGAGLVVGALAFVVAAAVERRRRRSALASGDGTSPLSVFLLAPQLAVMGVSGGFSLVGQTEFYNTQFPDQMRTLANAAFYCEQGISSYMATFVVNIVNARTRRGGGGSVGWVADDINAGRIDYFYYAMAVLTAANFVYFLVCAHFYQYKGEQAADSPAGPEPARDSGSACEIDAALLIKDIIASQRA